MHAYTSPEISIHYRSIPIKCGSEPTKREERICMEDAVLVIELIDLTSMSMLDVVTQNVSIKSEVHGFSKVWI